MLQRQNGNAAVGVIVTVGLIVFVAFWMWLSKNGLAPNIGMGIKISMPLLLGGLLLIVAVLAVLFFKSSKQSTKRSG